MKRKLNLVRDFSAEIKLSVVKDLGTRKNTVSGLSKLYKVSSSSTYNWIENMVVLQNKTYT